MAVAVRSVVSRLLAVCFLSVLCIVGPCHAAADEGRPGTSDEMVAQVRKKFGRKDIVQDIEHLKEDLKMITDLQLEGKLTEDETVFYFFRMHDFDNNNKLDGLELLAAMQHTEHHDHSSSKADPDKRGDFQRFIMSVDSLLLLDKDNDGFLEYSELQSSSGDDS
ncbi:unnamed protein product [Ixodes hexagonus]